MERRRYNYERKEGRMGGKKGEVPLTRAMEAHVQHRPTLAPRTSGRGEPEGLRGEKKRRAGRNEQHLAQQGGKRGAGQSCEPSRRHSLT